MEIVPGLHLVDGMETFGVNAYVWERPDGGLTLIDAGMPNSAETIVRFLNRLGRQRLDRIIVTHADIDHVGSLARIKAWTGATVLCHAVEKALLAGQVQRQSRASLLSWLYRPLYLLVTRVILRHPAVDADELVLDKQMLPEGFEVVHVPGHTAGQIALYEPERGILIAADALTNFGDRLRRPVSLFTPQMDIAEDSIRRLAGLRNVNVICCGHGPPITERAAERLQAFASSL